MYLVKNKSAFASIFAQFELFIENQLDLKVKCVRTDNAKELTEGDALQLCIHHGIKQ